MGKTSGELGDKQRFLDSLRKDLAFDEVLRGHRFTFHSTWGLFSPRQVDEGSRLLIEKMEVGPSDACLDLGCGYGPIGSVMAHLAHNGNTCLVDKDFVAVEYAQHNVRLNHLDNCEVFLSNGFSRVGQRRFDVVASNLPAKTGKEMLYLILYDALAHLNPGGRLYVVTISGLRRFIQRAALEVFGNYDKVKQGKSYTLALMVKAGDS